MTTIAASAASIVKDRMVWHEKNATWGMVLGEGRRRKSREQNVSTAANDLERRMQFVGDTEKRPRRRPRYTRDRADGDPGVVSGKGRVGKPGAFVNGQQHGRSGTRRAGRR